MATNLQPHSSPPKPRSEKISDRRYTGREAILNAAENLFAEHGFDGCTLRNVANQASVNQGMIHYFFKSKEALFLEAYMRHGQPLVDERLKRLAIAEAENAGQYVQIEKLIEIFLAPAVRLALSSSSGRAFFRMQARLQLDGTHFGRNLRSTLYDASSKKFIEAFRRSLPELAAEHVAWRFIFILGTYQYALADTGRLEVLSDQTRSSQAFDEALTEMVPFLAAGMRSKPFGTKLRNVDFDSKIKK